MKKIYIKLIAAALIFTSAYSCSADWLDVSPSDAATREEALSTYNDALVVLNGVYNGIKGTSADEYLYYYAAPMIYYGDVRGDDMQSQKGGNRSSWAYEMTYTAGARDIWRTPYQVIRRANTLIKALDDGVVADATQDQANVLKGEALMARALAHFDLLRVYSLPYQGANAPYGIPVVTEPLEMSATPGRNSVDETYTQIIKDLTDAASLMSGAKYAIGHFNSWAAKSLLSRVYLYKGDNDNAYTTAVDVITNSPFRLWKNEEYEDVWATAASDPSVTENLFEISITSNQDWTDREGIAYLYSEDGYADAHITKAFYDLLHTKYVGDVRANLFKEATITGTADTYLGKKVYVNKYPGKNTEDDFRIGNVPLLRLSETYLIAAEAAVKKSDKVNAAKYLNAIVLRGNPNATEVSSNDVTLDRVLQERRVELVGEGHRFFDLIRNNLQVVRYASSNDRGWHTALSVESQSFDRTYFRAILPIPQKEITTNPVIKEQQNPNY